MRQELDVYEVVDRGEYRGCLPPCVVSSKVVAELVGIWSWSPQRLVEGGEEETKKWAYEEWQGRRVRRQGE